MLADLNLTTKAVKSVNVFRDELFTTLCADYPEMSGLVCNAFDLANERFESKRIGFFERAEKDMSIHGVKLISETQLLEHLGPIFVRNHMCVASVEIKLNGNSIPFPLALIAELIPLSFYNPGSGKGHTPNLMVFFESTACSITFTYTGHINIVGGYTEPEIKYYLIRFLVNLKEALEKLEPNAIFIFKDAEIRNKMATSKLPLSKIDVYGLNFYLSSLGINKVYMPEEHNSLIVIPFSSFAHRIHIRLFPSGGITCYGINATYEITALFQSFLTLAYNYIRKQVGHGNAASIIELDAKLNKKRTSEEISKIKKRQKSLDTRIQQKLSLNEIHALGGSLDGIKRVDEIDVLHT